LSVNFPSAEFVNLERASQVGDKAAVIIQSDEWKWIYENIFGALQDQAILILKNAKTEEERIRAQQQFIAAHKPKEILEGFIRDGLAAREAMKEISTLEGENNG